MAVVGLDALDTLWRVVQSIMFNPLNLISNVESQVMQRVNKMFGLWTTILFIFVVVSSTGCSSESGSSKNNSQGADVSVEQDAHSGGDTASYDASTDGKDVDSEQKDVTTDIEQADTDDTTDTDDSATDASDDVAHDVEEDTSDASTNDDDVRDPVDAAEEADVPVNNDDPYKDRPMGQCTETLECEIMASGFRSCTRTAPGGLCSGCGDNDCGVMAECKFGTCQAVCTTKADCAPGLTCLSGGTCGIERCVNNVCPTPMFGCTASGFCERVACTQQADCPELTTCTDGLCIEDRQL